MTNLYCCDMMQYFMQNKCNIHNNRFECPDCIIDYNEKEKEYGIIIHDGGQSYIRINFCPWCGHRLSFQK